jgi:hypothetical protein
MSNLLLEIDEAMRRERMEKLWKQYGSYLVGFIVLVVLATGIYSGWRSWNESVRIKDTEYLFSLLDDAKFPDNIKPEALKMRAPLRGVALMNAAGEYLQSGKPAEALKLFEQTGKDKSIPSEIRHLALLMQARLVATDAKSQADPEEILQPVLKDTKSPWQPYALLEAAAFSANRGNDYTQARSYLKQILDRENLPQSLYGKAQALDRIYDARQQQNMQKKG